MDIVNETRRGRAIPLHLTKLNMDRIVKQCVGIDVSHQQIDVTFGTYSIDQSIVLTETKRFKNDKKTFPIFLKWALKRANPELPLYFTMEATGVYHEKLAFFLADNNQKVNVVLPTRASNYAKTMEVKTVTDKEASRTLTKMGLEKKLRLWCKPELTHYTLRQLTRERERLQKSKTALTNQIHALEICELSEPSERIKELVALISKHIKEIEKEIAKYIELNPSLKEEVSYMISIKGVGLITAATVLGETSGFKEIENKRQLISYSGYDVIRKDSGTSVMSKPRISKKGNRHIRKALYFPALTAIKHDANQKDHYVRMVQKHGIKMKAAVAIQRKLLILMYTLWKKKEFFDPDYDTDLAKKIGQLTLP